MTQDAAPATAPSGERIRLRYSKLGKIRFTSQRDVARMWERALRRSRLPVAWSQGFSPRPLLSFGLALPTGAESLGEYLDVRLAGPPGTGPVRSSDDLVELGELLTSLLPDGIEVQAAAVVPDDAGSLQQEVTSCDWDLEVHGVTAVELTARVERLLASRSVVVRRERKGRTVHDDLRPAVRMLALVTGEPGNGGCCRLRARLATRPRGVRPGELLEGLGADLVLARACRTHQWIERDGTQREPLGMGGHRPEPVAPHAQERAS